MYDVNTIDDNTTEALKAANEAYRTKGARSPAKVAPIHGLVIGELEKYILAHSRDLTVHGLGANNPTCGKEKIVEGFMRSKKVDIAIQKPDGTIPWAVSVKAPYSNYKQNSANYLEALLGELANLKLNGIGLSHFLLLPYRMPYLEKDGTIKHIEYIKDGDIEPFAKLLERDDIYLNALYIKMIDLWDFSNIPVGYKLLDNPRAIQPNSPKLRLLSDDSRKFIEDNSDITTFVKKVFSR